jgi:predicted transglutaminase-like cysteine proteinase
MVYRTVFFLIVLFWGLSAYAQDPHQIQKYASVNSSVLPLSKAPAFETVLGSTRAPMGWPQFCADEPRDCITHDRNETVQLTSFKKQELVRVNTQVNKDVTPMTDLDHYGVIEKWAYPDDGKGDCEDYALQKRRMLIQRGWPASALLMTVVRDQRNEGHAVLTVHTSAGDLILDNQRDEILAWNETGYHYVKRQSQNDVNEWVSLTDQVGADLAVSAEH